ncbi:DUF2752 domain-containing protein [Rhodococcus sp. IEGM 1379]|uniref:DUF2752 domain-containing protein n=1 Tax=Rhodococcus sp. IEGM 1379 TaxID=3047086 RepID=UPI0024B7F593|nr:DUF2752 domain-containing protein [Rhodococcus sp. IEGM 1379]MDI9914938.1 DUF2752 domain-containing protein [Rhodococcus sp. IEGM 1379]
MSSDTTTLASAKAPLGVAIAAIAVCAFISWSDPTTPGGVIPVCPTKALFNVNCPGCGSTRMLYSLIHGDVVGAAHFNAFGLAMLVALGFTYVSWTSARIRRKPAVMWHQMRWSPVIILTLVLIWSAVRIIPIPSLAELRV